MEEPDLLRKIIQEVVLKKFKIYYHGCSDMNLCAKIIKDGFIKPGNRTIKQGDKTTPAFNRTYFAENVKTGLVYLIGADILGTKMWKGFEKDYGRFGCLFVIPSSNFADLDPDEDNVGEAIWICSHHTDKNVSFNEEFQDNVKNWNDVDKQKYLNISKKILTPAEFKNCTKIGGKNAKDDFAAAGKKINQHINDYWKLKLINSGANVANEGKVRFTQVWRFDKNLTNQLNDDGSNFFNLATRIK